jgi:hypothetical protein
MNIASIIQMAGTPPVGCIALLGCVLLSTYFLVWVFGDWNCFGKCNRTIALFFIWLAIQIFNLLGKFFQLQHDIITQLLVGGLKMIAGFFQFLGWCEDVFCYLFGVHIFSGSIWRGATRKVDEYGQNPKPDNCQDANNPSKNCGGGIAGVSLEPVIQQTGTSVNCDHNCDDWYHNGVMYKQPNVDYTTAVRIIKHANI